jgi:hypothetical protein
MHGIGVAEEFKDQGSCKLDDKHDRTARGESERQRPTKQVVEYVRVV